MHSPADRQGSRHRKTCGSFDARGRPCVRLKSWRNRAAHWL